MYVVTRPCGNGAERVIAIADHLLDPQTIEALIALDELADIVCKKKQGGKMPPNGIQRVQAQIRTDWRQGQVCPHCGHDKLDEVGMCGSCKYDAQLGTSPVQLPKPAVQTVANACQNCDGCPSKNPNLCPLKQRSIH